MIKKIIFVAAALFSLFVAPSIRASNPAEMNSQGLKAYQAGRYEQAKQLFAEAIKAAPDFTGAELNLSITLIRLKDYRGAAVLSKKIYEQSKSDYEKSDAFFNGAKACKAMQNQGAGVEDQEYGADCAWQAWESGIYVYYKALLEKPSKQKYEMLEKYICKALLSNDATSNNHLTKKEIRELRSGHLPDTGNGMVGFDDKDEIVVFVHESGIFGNPPSVALYNSNAQSFVTFDTKEIYPHSGTYMAATNLGQWMYQGMTDTAFYVDRGSRDGQINTYSKVFLAH